MVLSKMNCCSKSGIHTYAPHSHIHVQTTHRVVMFSSVVFSWWSRRLLPCDELWPETRADCVTVLSFQLLDFPVVWFTCCKGFPRSCSISKRSPSFRFGKVHIPWLLFCCDRFLRCCVFQPAKVCIFLQSRLRTRRCVGFWISSHPAFKFPRSYEYHRNRTFFCGRGTCRNM